MLFVYGMFDDVEDIEFFCNDILLQNPAVKNLKFVVENSKNLIILIESNYTQRKLGELLHDDLLDENIKFYLLFKRDELVSANLPQEVKDFIWGKEKNDKFMMVEYTKLKESKNLTLDDVLDKIGKQGLGSLTKHEKNILNNLDE
jgi:hypothetical protein